MTFVPAMWISWGAVVIAFIVLKIYAARLARNEDDQILLNESSSNTRIEQAAIVERLHGIAPLQKIIMWVLGAATLFVVGYYVVDMINQFR
jgi:hypothetical protein